ncbi:hypothetical protein ACP70R_017848 [Stipagrostis hirtigluma subsp. patula]
MTKKSCHARADSESHHDQSKITGEPDNTMKHRQSGSSGPEAARKKTWKRYLSFLSKFHNKTKHKKVPDTRAPKGFKQRSPMRSSRPVLEECSNLVRVVRRATAGCFAAAAAAATVAGAGEEGLPRYVQLDQTSYGAKREEAFGPIYLVT